jgi:hypothetical protein
MVTLLGAGRAWRPGRVSGGQGEEHEAPARPALATKMGVVAPRI